MTDEQVEFLGSQSIATGGPFMLEMKVMLVGESGQYEGYDAWATIDLPPGKLPTREQIEQRLRSALDSTEGFRLATRQEFVANLLSEHSGVPGLKVSVPGPTEFEFSPASGIAARSDETAQQAQPEGQEPGPKGTPKEPSHE